MTDETMYRQDPPQVAACMIRSPLEHLSSLKSSISTKVRRIYQGPHTPRHLKAYCILVSCGYPPTVRPSNRLHAIVTRASYFTERATLLSCVLSTGSGPYFSHFAQSVLTETESTSFGLAERRTSTSFSRSAHNPQRPAGEAKHSYTERRPQFSSR